MSSKLPPAFGVVIVCAAAFFSGCMTSVRTALAPATKDAIKTTALTTGLTQPEIGTDIVASSVGASAGASGGLIGGLIGGIVDASVNTSRAKSAETVVAPIRNAMVGYDANATLREAFHPIFADSKLLGIQSVEIAPVSDDASCKRIVKAANTDAVMIIRVDHRFNPEFSAIKIEATATLFAKKVALATNTSGDLTVLYSNKFVLLSDAAPSGNKDANISYWANEKGEHVKSALSTGFREIAEMIAFDLPVGPEVNLPKEATLETTAPGPQLPGQAAERLALKGTSVHTDAAGRKWIRLANGALSSVKK